MKIHVKVENLIHICKHISEQHVISVDTETTGFNCVGGVDRCIGVSIAAVIDGKPVSHYYGVHHEVGDNISISTLEQLKYILQDGRPLS